MSVLRLSLTALVVVSLAGCSSATNAKTSAAPAAAATTPTTSAASTSATASPVAGGGATDFCSAYKEFKNAAQADTPQAQGAGFRAAATDLRTFAPAAIKQAAGVYADVMDEVGQAIEAGKPNPGLLGSGQSSERRQAIADSITWIAANCH